MCSVSLTHGAVDWSAIVAFPGNTHLLFDVVFMELCNNVNLCRIYTKF